jgi:hypothetical protein
MRNTEERERHFQKVINRWENDGGAVAKNEFPRRRVFDDHNAGENPAFIPGNAERKQTPGVLNKARNPALQAQLE